MPREIWAISSIGLRSMEEKIKIVITDNVPEKLNVLFRQADQVFIAVIVKDNLSLLTEMIKKPLINAKKGRAYGLRDNHS